MFKTLVFIGLGGGFGSIFRYLTALLVQKYVQSLFPFATFVANVLGSLLIGLLVGLFDKHYLTNPNLKFLFITGFCGGYTTFSTFANENTQLLQKGEWLIAFFYIFVSLFCSLLAVWLGLTFVKNL